MYIKVNEEGKITAACSIKADDSFIETAFNLFDFSKFNYFIKNGEVVAEELPQDEDDALQQLRLLRESECFPIINRGKLWYDTLTDEQVKELEQWYNAWLNVTETKTIPEKPDWLK